MTGESLLPRIQADMAAALKAGEADTLGTLRMLKAALLEAKTQKPREVSLTPDEEIEVLQRYVKKRRELIDELRRLGREDLLAREQREIDVTLRYLPAPLGEEEVRDLVREVIRETGASGVRDTGKVIGAVMGRARGRVEGSLVSRVVREQLS